MEQLLSLAVITKNSLITIGGYTPQQAVFGQQSPLLPDMSQGDALLEDERSTHRLREIVLQRMIQASAREGSARATRSKTRISTKSSGLSIRQTVEFYREP